MKAILKKKNWMRSSVEFVFIIWSVHHDMIFMMLSWPVSERRSSSGSWKVPKNPSVICKVWIWRIRNPELNPVLPWRSRRGLRGLLDHHDSGCFSSVFWRRQIQTIQITDTVFGTFQDPVHDFCSLTGWIILNMIMKRQASVSLSWYLATFLFYWRCKKPFRNL